MNRKILAVMVLCGMHAHHLNAFTAPQSIPAKVETIVLSAPTETVNDPVIDSKTIELPPESRAVYHVKKAYGLKNGSVHAEFSSLKMPGSFMPLKSGSAECFCAFKIHIGRIVFELSDIGPRIALLDKKHLKTDSVLAVERIDMIPDGSVHIIDASIEDGIARLIMDSDTILSAPVPLYDFSMITMSAFGHTFTVHSMSVYRLIKPELYVQPNEKALYMGAVWHKARFNNGKGLGNHHFITWENGKAAQSALITVKVPDSTVYHTLKNLGATPGNNLTVDSWNKIKSPKSQEPDKHAEGSNLEISIIYGISELSIQKVLADKNGNPYNFRFAGNLAFIPVWRSGCVACLQSCPGSKVANSTYSMRDLEKGKASFTVQDKLPFKDEEEILVRIKVVP